MASEVDTKLDMLRAKAEKKMYNPTKGIMQMLTQSRDAERGILADLVEYTETSSLSLTSMDIGISRMVRILEQAFEATLVPSIPVDKKANEGTQFTLEFLNLIDTRIEEGNGLMRGVLSQVTRIRTVIDDMLKRQEDMEDKKVFKNPDQQKKDEPKVKLKEGKGGILETLMELGGWLLTPITKWLWPWLKEKWTGFKKVFKEKIDNIVTKLKGWFDNIATKVKGMFDDAIKWFAKKFPKITGFFKGIAGAIKKVFSSTVGKWIGTGVKLMGKLGFQIFGKIFSIVGKVLGKLILPIMLVYDFFMGWFNADEITGKAKDALSLWDKIAAGFASILSGLTLGLVSAQDWYEVIFGDYGIVDIVAGFFKDLWESLPEGFKGVLTSIYSVIEGLAGVAMNLVKSAFGDNITQRIETLFDDIAKWMDENISWAKLKPSWLPSFGSEEDEIDAKNKAFTKVQNAKSVPLMLDTSSKSHSDKKAFLEAKNKQVPLVVQAAAPSVTVTSGGSTPNVFEGDMFMQLIGR